MTEASGRVLRGSALLQVVLDVAATGNLLLSGRES